MPGREISKSDDSEQDAERRKREEKKARHREYCRRRYNEDPEYKTKVRESQRKYESKSESKAKRREQQIKRMNDPEYRVNLNERHRLYQSDPEKKARRAKYESERRNDPVAVAKRLERGRKYRASTEGRIRQKESKLRRTYGISYAQYKAMLDVSRGRCPICKLSFDRLVKPMEPHIDHCHETSKIRGILCRKCNLAIGLLADNPTLLRRAITYLKNSGSLMQAILAESGEGQVP